MPHPVHEASGALFRRKPLDLPPESSGLRRVLGPWTLLALGVGATIGAGLFSLTGIAAGQNAGPAVTLSYVIAAIACGFSGLCYCELAGMIPISGSAYSYAYVAMGELIAWIIGWDLILEYAVGVAAVSVSWSGYATSLLAEWGLRLPPRLTATPLQTLRLPDGGAASGLANLPAIFIIVLVSLLLIRGTSASARLNTAIVAVKLGVIALFIGCGIPWIDTANYHPFLPPNDGTTGHFGFSGVMRAAGTVFFAYLGFDALSTTTQETRNPRRDMPIGILGSLLVCTLVYVCFSLVLTGIVNYTAMADDPAPVATAIDRTHIGWLQIAIKLGVICGFTSVLLLMLLGQSRIFFVMSKDGLLPPVFSRLHPRFATPWLSNLFFMALTSLFAAFLPIDELGRMTSIGTLLAFVIVCASVPVLRRAAPTLERPFRVPGGALIPALGILSCLGVMVSLDLLTWVRLLVWLAIGLAIYAGYGRRHSRLARV
jgi:APA family basic amino acid/polyamine antiporter